MEKCLIFFDIDETLYINKTDTIPESAVEAIHKLKAAGHTLAIATGRSEFEIIRAVRDLPFDIYVMTNGQHVVQNGNLIYENPIDVEIIKQLINKADKEGIYLGLVSASKATVTGFTDEMQKNMEDINAEIPIPTIDSKLYEKESILQMWVFSEKFDEFKVGFEESVRFVPWIDPGGDILPIGTSKASGIKKLIEANDGALPEKVVFFGDGPNDIEIIQLADIGVAMGNAVDSLKEHADFVTKSIEDNGIYYACEELGLF